MHVIPLRPVVVPWTCDRRGDCCTRPAGIIVTAAERDELLHARPAIAAEFVTRPDGWVWLRGRPCPCFGRDAKGKGVCTVYAIRPFNCRRFLCGRVGDEAWQEDDGVCLNLEDRLNQSRPFRRFYALVQRRAQVWARAHGWTDDLPRATE
jgi:Fe-S-cluster containining protein